MAKTAERSATYEDLLKVPDNLIAEIVDGELFASPRPASRHMRTAARLLRKLGDAFDDDDRGARGWWIAIEEEIHLNGEVFVPDLAGWRRERVPEQPAGLYWEIVPDWVCEVVSPSSARLDRIRKLPRYAAHQVRHAWIVDPFARTLEIYRLVEGQWLLVGTHEGDDVVRAEPFDSIELSLSSLWA